MPTNYPASIDNFIDPTPTEPMNSPSHSTQHANHNDAIIAIETAIGTTGSPKFATGASVTTAVGVETTRATAAEALALPKTGGTMTGPIVGLQDKGSQVFFAKAYGTMDPTGATDSTAAILAAIAAAAANTQGGVVQLPPGIFKISSSLVVNSNLVSIIGAGNAATILEPTSALNGGTVLTVQMSPFQTGVNYFQAGTFSGFTIDGANTTNATGLQFGDIVGGRVDLSVNNFRGASGVGVNFVNTTNWTEENFIRLYVNLNTIGAKFGLVGSGTNSFGYNDIDIFVRCGGGLYTGQIGVQISTAVQVYHGKFRMTGNLANSAIGIKGVASGTTYGGLGPAVTFDIVVETNDASACVPLQLPGYFQFYGNGIVDTTGGNYNPNSSLTSSSLAFTGWWNVPGGQPKGLFSNQATGNIMATGMPTADPHVVGALWANASIVTVSAG